MHSKCNCTNGNGGSCSHNRAVFWRQKSTEKVQGNKERRTTKRGVNVEANYSRSYEDRSTQQTLIPTGKWWRRGELNPRPRSLATRSLHAYPVPKVSPAELRTGKTRCQLVR